MLLNQSENELGDLVRKYNRSGPRYTSYPTVPVWPQGRFGEEYTRALEEEGKLELPLAVYVHIPFCSRLCTFCGCNKVITRDKDLVKRYLDALELEIEAVTERLGRRKKLSQLHLGGGTPTYLDMGQFERLAKMLHRHFEIEPEGEWALEANPSVTSVEQLEGLHALGFRRISFGIQDLDQDVQRAINRNQTPEQTREAIRHSRRIGYESINFDLVYGLPLQTRSSFRRTLEGVSKLRPDRLAVYSFAHLPWMFKSHDKALRKEDLPSPDEKIGLYLDAVGYFSAEGYEMIGMDHFALPDDELAQAAKKRTLHRNFMGYTTLDGMNQIGLGVSAISDLGDSYWQNPKDIEEYMALASDPVPHRRMFLDEDDRLRRTVIDTLMCHGEIPVAELESKQGFRFREYFHEAWPTLQEFADEGLITIAPDVISLNETGRLFMRNVAMPFDRYMNSSSTTQFSKTV